MCAGAAHGAKDMVYQLPSWAVWRKLSSPKSGMGKVPMHGSAPAHRFPFRDGLGNNANRAGMTGVGLVQSMGVQQCVPTYWHMVRGMMCV